eukprot:SAG22_NODE_930_length_6462_cov_4.402326_2_plen_204_part_00
MQGDAKTVLLTHQWADTGCCGWRKYTPGGGNCNTPANCPPLVPAKYYKSVNNRTGCWASTRYLGPIKQVKIFGDGSPRVVYWPGNDKLKGELIVLPSPQPLLASNDGDNSSNSNGNGATPPAIKMYDRVLDLRASIVVEATLSCTDTSTRAGFVNNYTNAFVYDCATQRLSIGPIEPAAPGKFSCGLADGPEDHGIYDGHHLC